MTAGGLTGAGGSSATGATKPPSSSQTNSTFPINSNATRQASGDGKKPGGKPEQQTVNAGSGQAASGDEQGQKAREFDASQGRPPIGEKQGDGNPNADGSEQEVVLAGMVGAVPLGGIAGAAGAAGRVIVGGAGIGAAGAVLVTPTNSSHDQNVPIPGNEHYQIAGKMSESTREVQVANADGTWTTLGHVSIKPGGRVDMTQVNDVLKDRGFEPVSLPPMPPPGRPINDQQGPSIIFTPDQGGRGVNIISTPNNGPRGAEVMSTPIQEEQGVQILNIEINKGHILDGEIVAGEAKGFHHRVGGFDPANAELDELTRPPDKNGVYEGEVSVRDPETGKMVPKDFPSTFFPDRMTGQEVEQAIQNAYEKRYDQKQSDGPFEGPSGHGFRIRGHAESGNVKAAWPIPSGGQ